MNVDGSIGMTQMHQKRRRSQMATTSPWTPSASFSSSGQFVVDVRYMFIVTGRVSVDHID